LALILAFFTARFIAANPVDLTFFTDFFGRVTLGIIGLLGLFTILAFAGYEDKIFNKLGLAILLTAGAGFTFFYLGFRPVFNDIGLLAAAESILFWMLETGAIWAVVVAVVIWLVIREPGSSGESGTSLWKLFNKDIVDDGDGPEG
jgi:hypothetical protein